MVGAAERQGTLRRPHPPHTAPALIPTLQSASEKEGVSIRNLPNNETTTTRQASVIENVYFAPFLEPFPQGMRLGSGSSRDDRGSREGIDPVPCTIEDTHAAENEGLE